MVTSTLNHGVNALICAAGVIGSYTWFSILQEEMYVKLLFNVV